MPKIDANTRDFETELAAQQAETTRTETELHPEATVVTATAL
ncbi:MAG: hypothetical protein ABEJ91_01465 [Candidatus Nanohaloarchaea archaeon]